MKPKVVSLFSGAGGMDLGFKKAGYDVVWSNDIDRWAVKTYRRNFPDADAVCGDIRNIDACEIPDCGVVIGGFPCQDFSVLGGSTRKGITAKRGKLYKEFIRVVKAKNPKVFVAENVKGILSANKGLAAKIIKHDFEHIFSLDVEKNTENFGLEEINLWDNGSLFSANTKVCQKDYFVFIGLYKFVEYGVPQLRERVLIVGIRKDVYESRKIPFRKAEGFLKTPEMYVTSGDALEGKTIYSIPVSEVSFNNEKLKIRPKTIEMLKHIPEGGNFKNLPKRLAVKGLMSNIYKRLHRNKPSSTIIANGGGGTWGYHYEEPRALTNRERARLQTFPDEFVFEGPVGEVRKQIGNAVPPLGILPTALSLKKYLIDGYQPDKDSYYKDWERLKEEIVRYKKQQLQGIVYA
ncbi:MAG: DNA (cytosine-5-)-methyltransferase [Nitrospiraceae bacterium]|nr:DNA (cytosine-5-)-methyltransferase [Nitrospiraceae bacterium]